MNHDFHKRIVLGVELESYTITIPEYQITRALAFPRRGLGEKGERFAQDTTIGTEYNSRPFMTIREGLFLLKAGLRKYSKSLYASRTPQRDGHQLLLTGGWRDRYAGAHVHISVADQPLTPTDAQGLAWHIHDHIPFLIAIGGNSPVWSDKITGISSNRVIGASAKYVKPIKRGELTTRTMNEMTFSRGRKTKPATLEIRVLDSNIPDFIITAACVIKAACLAALAGKKAANRIGQRMYLKARNEAALKGMRSTLCWNGEWMTAARYLDRFIWVYRNELEKMDVPDDVWMTARYLKRRLNGAAILESAARKAYREHPQTWQRRFARNYVQAINQVLSGNSVVEFARRLGVDLPSIENVSLGGKNLKIF